jgi:hypothetical protein
MRAGDLPATVAILDGDPDGAGLSRNLGHLGLFQDLQPLVPQT